MVGAAADEGVRPLAGLGLRGGVIADQMQRVGVAEEIGTGTPMLTELVGERHCACGVAAHQRRADPGRGEEGDGKGRGAGAADLLDALVDRALRGVGIGDHQADRQRHVGAGHHPLARRAGERDGGARVGDAGFPVAGGDVVEAGDGERVGAHVGREVVGERGLAPGAFLAPGLVVGAPMPVDRQAQPRDPFAVSPLVGPRPRRPEVAGIGPPRRHPVQPPGFKGPLEPCQVPRAHGLRFAGGEQAIEGIETDGLEQPVAVLLRMQRDQRLVDQGTESVDDVAGGEALAGADALGGGEREAVDEHGTAP